VKKIFSIEQEIENTRKATLNLLVDLEEERTALSIAKAKDEAILESLGDGVVATDEEGVIISINSTAEKLLKCNRSEFLGKMVFEVLPIFDDQGDMVPLEDRPFQMAFVSGARTMAKYSYERTVGSRFPAAITVTPIIFEKRNIGAIEIFRDISKEVELDKAKDDFISLASHQLKGPITAISWSLGGFLIRNKTKLNKGQKELLGKVYEINKGMLGLVGGFLDITKMETSGFAVQTGEVDLKEICNLVIEELQGQVQDKKIEIIKKYDDRILISNIGIKTARIIFQNLLTNAIKYSSEKGKVEISIEKSDTGIHIYIKDYGYGIPEKAKKFIFTKLFRAANAKEREPGGTGLGLYLVKSLLDKFGGRIWFESLEGNGTTFFVDLPK